jgi:hypothetical protein
LDNNKKYIGYHKGNIDDGYICSSSSDVFWSDWETCAWQRQIIGKGSVADCVELEKELLNAVDIQSDEWYNNARGGGIVFTEEVRAKMRRKFTDEHKQKLSDAKKGRKLSAEHIKKLNEGRRNAPRNLTSESMKKTWAKKKANGFKFSEEAKQNMSKGRMNIPAEERSRIGSIAGKKSAEQWKNESTRKKHSERMKLWWKERKESLHDD